jgi:hypothetical protein
MAYNSAEHAITKKTPYSMVYGHEMRLPIDVMLGEAPEITDKNGAQYVNNLSKQLNKAWTNARELISGAQKRSADYYDKRVRADTYQPGDLVLCYSPQIGPEEIPKFHRDWSTPYVVVSRINDVNYKIRKFNSMKTKIVHFNRLRLYKRLEKIPEMEEFKEEEKEDDNEEDDSETRAVMFELPTEIVPKLIPQNQKQNQTVDLNNTTSNSESSFDIGSTSHSDSHSEYEPRSSDVGSDTSADESSEEDMAINRRPIRERKVPDRYGFNKLVASLGEKVRVLTSYRASCLNANIRNTRCSKHHKQKFTLKRVEFLKCLSSF